MINRSQPGGSGGFARGEDDTRFLQFFSLQWAENADLSANHTRPPSKTQTVLVSPVIDRKRQSWSQVIQEALHHCTALVLP